MPDVFPARSEVLGCVRRIVCARLDAESDFGDARLRSTSSTEINRQLHH